jgi:CheY-like chemotaxis protein
MTDDPRLAEIPVIVLSAMAGDRPLRAQGFVHKPFALETLVAAIRGCLPEEDGAPAFN